MPKGFRRTRKAIKRSKRHDKHAQRHRLAWLGEDHTSTRRGYACNNGVGGRPKTDDGKRPSCHSSFKKRKVWKEHKSVLMDAFGDTHGFRHVGGTRDAKPTAGFEKPTADFEPVACFEMTEHGAVRLIRETCSEWMTRVTEERKAAEGK